MQFTVAFVFFSLRSDTYTMTKIMKVNEIVVSIHLIEYMCKERLFEVHSYTVTGTVSKMIWCLVKCKLIISYWSE